MDGFKQPARPPRPSETPSSDPPQSAPPVVDQQLPPVDLSLTPHPGRPTNRWYRPSLRLAVIVVLILLVIVALCVSAVAWYQAQLRPVDSQNHTVQQVQINEGASFSYINGRLKERGLIRSTLAFEIYARLHGLRDSVKSGTCNLMPSESTPEIVEKLTKGCHDFKVVTFYPGATLQTSLYAKTKAQSSGEEFNDFSISHSLLSAGYSDSSITKALSATYDGPLFANKPASSSYEGYVFGETYYVNVDATAEEVLKTAFDQMYKIVQRDDLVAKFKAHGLTLYQGITLASIVEKELDCEGKPTEARKATCYGYQQKIAQVFYNRLHKDMTLGSDVTFIYAADRLGTTPSVDIDSPYNTRKHTGLPPGPIASPGELALKAVANPTATDDLYFIAGDDGLIYFARTQEQHEANIAKYCQKLCSQL